MNNEWHCTTMMLFACTTNRSLRQGEQGQQGQGRTVFVNKSSYLRRVWVGSAVFLFSVFCFLFSVFCFLFSVFCFLFCFLSSVFWLPSSVFRLHRRAALSLRSTNTFSRGLCFAIRAVCPLLACKTNHGRLGNSEIKCRGKKAPRLEPAFVKVRCLTHDTCYRASLLCRRVLEG
jgi:hypothetical protein